MAEGRCGQSTPSYPLPPAVLPSRRLQMHGAGRSLWGWGKEPLLPGERAAGRVGQPSLARGACRVGRASEGCGWEELELETLWDVCMCTGEGPARGTRTAGTGCGLGRIELGSTLSSSTSRQTIACECARASRGAARACGCGWRCEQSRSGHHDQTDHDDEAESGSGLCAFVTEGEAGPLDSTRRDPRPETLPEADATRSSAWPRPPAPALTPSVRRSHRAQHTTSSSQKNSRRPVSMDPEPRCRGPCADVRVGVCALYVSSLGVPVYIFIHHLPG